MPTVMRKRAFIAALACLAAAGCATHLSPGLRDIGKGQVPRFQSLAPVEVRGDHAYAGDRKVYVPGGGTVLVNEDEFTTALVTGVREQLQEQGVRVESGAAKVIEARVVRVLIHPKPAFTCVIDYNVKLGTERPRGLQSRAESWMFKKSCSDAVTQAVVDLLNAQHTQRYLRGQR